jgi:hypothetical protein
MQTDDSLGTRTWGLADVVQIRVLHVVGSATDSFPCDKCHQEMVWGWKIRLEKKTLPDDTIHVCMTCLDKLAEPFRKKAENVDGE